MPPPEHVNKTMSQKRVFVVAFKDIEVRSSWVWVALNPVSRFLVRVKRRETDTEDKLHEDKGRDRRERPASPETPGAPETGKGRENPHPGAPGGPHHLDLRRLVSRTGGG